MLKHYNIAHILARLRYTFTGELHSTFCSLYKVRLVMQYILCCNTPESTAGLCNLLTCYFSGRLTPSLDALTYVYCCHASQYASFPYKFVVTSFQMPRMGALTPNFSWRRCVVPIS